ncbi:unnamed protein product, partial [Cyprideis torosa]
SRNFPNDADAIDAAYRTLRNGHFATPLDLKAVFPSLDNFRYKDKWWVIDIGGNNLRLIAFIEFRDQRIQMNFSDLKTQARALFDQASFIIDIKDEADYETALLLMDELIEDYDKNRGLIEVLSHSIEKWEDTSSEFTAFNQRIAQLDDGVAVLKTLMDQYQLKAGDLKAEVGSKSLVSMILNGSRQLTREHIQALSLRFHLSPAIFFRT